MLTAGPPVATGSGSASTSGRSSGPATGVESPLATGGATSTTGAETGSVGRRRRPGMADRTEPKPMRPAPTHSHMTSGCSTTPKAHTAPLGLVAMVR